MGKTINNNSTSVVPLKIGVAGIGHMGKYHVNVLSQLRQVQFVGVYDKNPTEAKRVAEEFFVQFFDDFDKFCASVDAVILATPTSTHYELGKKILLSNKHLLIEKPVTNDLNKARELIELAQNQNCKLLIGHVERYNAAIQELEKIISKPYYWESKRVGPNTFNRIFDVGVVLDLMIHDIDILIRVIKKDVTSISAVGNCVLSEFEDVVQANIQFSDGTVAGLMVSRLHHFKERLLRIAQKDETIFLDFTTQDISIYRGAESQVTTNKGSIRYQQHSTVERVFIHKDNPLKIELEYFIKMINENLPNENEWDLKTLEISLEIIRQVYEQLPKS